MINLTQHQATPEQLAAGVFDLIPEERARLCTLLTFDDLPSVREMHARATEIGDIASRAAFIAWGYDSGRREALIGGAPFFMRALERALAARDIACLYSFSRRESVEELQADGSVRKINVFRHAGFVPA